MAKLYSGYKEFLINLLTLKKKKKVSGYIMIKDKYFEHRVVMELFLNRMLSKEEVVHHIDRNKSNNKIANLKVMSSEEHLSMHHAGLKKPNTNKNPSHKLSNKKIKEIKKLSKIILKKNGKPNYSQIGKKLNISDFTVARHLKN